MKGLESAVPAMFVPMPWRTTPARWLECVNAERNVHEGIPTREKHDSKDFRRRVTAVTHAEERMQGLLGHAMSEFVENMEAMELQRGTFADSSMKRERVVFVESIGRPCGSMTIAGGSYDWNGTMCRPIGPW